MDIWFNPQPSSPACMYRVASPTFAPAAGMWRVQVVYSLCGCWKSRVDLDKAVEVKSGLAPSFEICAKCAALANIVPKPQAPVLVHLSLFSSTDRLPIEDMPSTAASPETPDEYEGVDFTEL
ncbi:MAG: hypothetical protein WAV09_03490 [Minisyncoccia bacterium]